MSLGRPYEVQTKERLLRAAIVGAACFALPIPPSAVVGVHAVWVTFTALASVCGGVVVLSYAVWFLGRVSEHNSCSELIGDHDLDVPPVYWPWGPYQREVRRRRRVRQLERACGITEPWPL